MPITKYDNYFSVGQVGQIATIEDSNVKTRKAEQVTEFGRALVKGSIAGVDVKNITKSKAVLTFDADFVASNTIDLKVNSVSIAQVVFNTDQATTLNALISATFSWSIQY